MITYQKRFSSMHESVLSSRILSLATSTIQRVLDGEYSTTILGYPGQPTRQRNLDSELVLPLDQVGGSTMCVVIPAKEHRLTQSVQRASPKHAANLEYIASEKPHIIEEKGIRINTYVATIHIDHKGKTYRAAIAQDPRHMSSSVEELFPHQNGIAHLCDLEHDGDRSYVHPSIPRAHLLPNLHKSAQKYEGVMHNLRTRSRKFFS